MYIRYVQHEVHRYQKLQEKLTCILVYIIVMKESHEYD